MSAPARWRLLRWPAAVALTIVCAPMALGAGPAAPRWSVARSPHFEVYATGSPSRAVKATEMFEEARTFLTAYLGAAVSTRPPVRVIVFSGDKEFAPYRANEAASAFYQPAADHDYIVMKDFDGDAFHVVAHEYSHAALGLQGADLPPWLGEGLAEFLSSVSLIGGKARLGAAPPGRVATLRPSALLGVPQLLAVRRDSSDYGARDHAGLFYAESWALTHMLMVDPRYRGGSAQLFALAMQGVDSADALSRVYGKPVAAIERDFRAYVGRGDYAFFTVDAPKNVGVPISAPATVPAFDASLVLAEMVCAQPGRAETARAMLEGLSREQPENLSLLEMRALLEMKALGMAAAVPYFQRAVERGSRNPTVLAQYALRVAEADPKRASDLLARALAAAPANVEIRIHAAAVLARRELNDEAMAVLAPVTRVPSNMEFEYYQIIANVRAANGDLDEAAAAAARVLAAARSPQERTFASAFMAQVGGPSDMTKVIDGRLTDLACDGDLPIMTVTTSGGTIRLAIDDPDQIMIAGGKAKKLDLACGEQDMPIRVGYAEAKPPPGTVGRVRFLDFRKKN